MTTMPYTPVYDTQDFSDLGTFALDHPDYCSLSSTPISCITYYPQPKEVDCFASEFLSAKTFTELLAGSNEPVINEYDYHQCAAVSSPESDCAFMDDSKIKHEYCDYNNWELYNNIPRTTDTADLVCNPASITTTTLTPIASPHDQSPIMHPSMLPASLIEEEQEVSADVLNTQVVSTDQQQQQDYRPLVVTPPQTPARSRGRRMSARPAKPGTKCFECNYAGCGKVFKRSEHLKRHVRSIHTLERPFSCPFPHCSKRFSRSDNLSQHIRVHRPNGREKNQSARAFNNFTPFLQTYPNGNIHATISN